MVSPVSSVVTVLVVIAFMVLLLLQRIPVGGAAQVTGQLPLSPRCFLVAGKLACSAADGALSTRRARGRKFPQGNQRRRSAAGTFPAPLAPTKEGLDGVERTPRIRRTATKRRRRQTGPGSDGALRRHTLDPTAGRASGRPKALSVDPRVTARL